MKRWQLIALGFFLLLVLGLTTGYRAGTRLLKREILEALGPSSHLTALRVNWFSLELIGLSIGGPKGWPAARTLEAKRVVVVPDLRSLLSERIRISSILVDEPHFSMLRLPGKLVMVPSLTEYPAGKHRDNTRHVVISKIEIKNGTLEVYDATVSSPPLRTRIEEIDALIRDVTAPAVGKTRFEIAGIVKGISRDGAAKLSGWAGPGGSDSWSNIILDGVDLVPLQPYLVKHTETRVSKGILDLNLDSTVRNNNLDGKGIVLLKQLQFAPAQGLLDTFMGAYRATR